MRLKRTVATITVVRRILSVCVEGKPCSNNKASYVRSTRRHRLGTEAKSPLDYGAAMRFGVSTQKRKGTAQRRTNANAKRCKCE
eukprot:6213036-Pleurochrysis_carterae.AAC.1